MRYEAFIKNLNKPLAAVYVLNGDEPLQMTEGADALRAAARDQGFLSRTVLNVESGFDWSELTAVSSNMSLFAEQQIIDLRIPTGKPGRDGGKALSEYVKNPPPDTLLLVTLPRLDKRAQSTAWFKALASSGEVIDIWPIGREQLPIWIGQRMRAIGVQAEPAAIEYLAERTEGNLLACAQEIDKLLLLNGSGTLNLADVELAVADSARFGVFELTTVLLSGEANRADRVLQRLQGEGEDLPPLIGILARDLRILARIAGGQEDANSVFRSMNVFGNRQAAYRRAAARLPAKAWRKLLARTALVDRAAKGHARQTDPWAAFWQILLLACGVRVPPRTLSS